MAYSLYDILWFILIYSFIGWCLEILFAAISKRKFMNRGLLNGPFCPLYGCIMVFVLIFFQGLKEHPVFFLTACTVTVGIMEFAAGAVMEKIFKRKWWDYSDYKYNLSGYVSIPFTLLWGVGAMLAVRFLQPLLVSFVNMIPSLVGHVILIAAGAIILCDIVVTVSAILNIKYQNKHMQDIAERMNKVSKRLGNAIAGRVQKRVIKAYPNLKDEKSDRIVSGETEENNVFAYGCSFHKLVWLFFIGAFLGDITETIFCRFAMGRWMSRSSVIYGPFSIVWGLGIAMLTFILHRYKDKGDRYIFVFGTVLGGVYEYVCSVFTELAFGTVFWDYSHIPFNIGGRVNLLYCFFWGIAAVIWIKIAYPFLSRLIERVPKRPGKIISYIMIVFMVFNMAISALALARYSMRANGEEACTGIGRFLDEHYTDERMERIYPNAIMKESE